MATDTDSAFERAARGFAGIGIYASKFDANVGTLVRTAGCLDAGFVYTVARRWQGHTTSLSHERHLPTYHFDSLGELEYAMPNNADIVGVELVEDATSLPGFRHPERAVYLLGGEDCGLDDVALDGPAVEIPARYCLNVGVAGSIVLYDRVAKRLTDAFGSGGGA